MKIPLLICAGAIALIRTSASAAPPATPDPPAPKTAPSAPSGVPKGWKSATAIQRAAAAASIRAQLDAFKRNDWAKAATYQSEGLRQNFGTVAQFRAIIETNYPQFAKYKTVAFDQAIAMGDSVQIQVRLTGQDGKNLRAIYLMKKEKGIYRVEGVQGGSVGGKSAPLPPNPADYV